MDATTKNNRMRSFITAIHGLASNMELVGISKDKFRIAVDEDFYFELIAYLSSIYDYQFVDHFDPANINSESFTLAGVIIERDRTKKR